MEGRNPTRRIDLDRAKLSPAAVFSTPEQVAGHSELTPRQKIEILRRWEADAIALSVATAEGMPDGHGELLRRIILLRERLEGADEGH